MRKTIQDVKIGYQFVHPKYGTAMVTNKTKRTIEVTFANGNKIKVTYKNSDAYFYESDFN